MTLEQSLKALKAAFGAKSSEAETVSKQLSAAKANAEARNAEVSDLSEKLAAVSGVVAERDSLAAKVEELTKALAVSNELKAQAAAQIETVGKVAAKIASSVGVAPAEISRPMPWPLNPAPRFGPNIARLAIRPKSSPFTISTGPPLWRTWVLNNSLYPLISPN